MQKTTKKSAVEPAAPAQDTPKTRRRRGRKKVRRTPAARGPARKKRAVQRKAKRGGRRGGVRTRGPRAATIQLPTNDSTGIEFWSEMITFLNANKNRSFVIQLDGQNLYLTAE